MKTIHLKTNNFQILSINFVGTILMLSILEILVLTALIYGGLR